MAQRGDGPGEEVTTRARRRAFFRSACRRIAMDWLWEFLRHVHDAYGVNLVHFYDNFERARLLRGMWTTLKDRVNEERLNFIKG